MVEFLGYRFAFNTEDFEQRVTAAAVKLGLVEDNDLDEDETEDLVELAADGLIEEPRSSLGRYLVRHWEQLSLIRGESLVYWLRKLVFRGAWLDHRVKEGCSRSTGTTTRASSRTATRAATAPCSSWRPCRPGTKSSSAARRNARSTAPSPQAMPRGQTPLQRRGNCGTRLAQTLHSTWRFQRVGRRLLYGV